MATPKDANDPDKCPQCSNRGRLRAVATVAQDRDDLRLTYVCQHCGHGWTVVKPAYWITKLGED